MGSGRWSAEIYEERERARAAAGRDAFDYFDRMASTPRTSWKPHPTLDPFGVKVRESRDSDEHPESLAIVVFFDVTGSMLSIPVALQRKLPELLGLLLRKGYVEHPQILFGAIGDATCDRVPLQVGQFESDNRMDSHLQNLVLEGGGGGQKTESYELAMYFLARHTAIDCWEKRHHKGYVFVIGDEMAYPRVKRGEVRHIVGGGIQSDIPVGDIVAELMQRYEVFYLLPRTASHGGDAEVLRFWQKLLGQNARELDEPEAVCEMIALTIGLCEGTTDLDEAAADLEEMGASREVVRAVTHALHDLPTGHALAKVTGTGLPGLATPEPRLRTRRV